ncbi:MAG: substrate-binding domain-containing protein [Methylobacteriaceae bacterium]|nr:substrate-binding domain-containing protein [Methylobacteriaceae bacterium]MBV9222041.1 substrate-binding domain-containing protein [Methylobacteriaceae bacterium]MBV9245826.1 substrate-binding domain-containing protein [Methylobacteriaceae bacterium]MBV9703941.1 substrate-binding domain-containing protein [Methylobacteriaceae bacterium]
MKKFALGVGVAAISACLAVPAAADALKIVLTVHGATSNEFWQPVKKGFEDACGKIQADCQMLFTSTNGSIEQQAANMEAALAGNPDALITTIADDKAFNKIIDDARAKGIIVIATNADNTKGAAGSARQAYIGQGLAAAGYSLAKYMATKFPKDGAIHVLVGINDPSANWSVQRASGILKGLEEFKAANPGRDITIDKLDSGGDNATAADRVGAYLNAHPETTAYLETGSQDVAVARVLKDRGIAPGKVLLGGFDVESDVLQVMKAGYIQAHVDQQPYMQGFMPVMEVYLAKTVGLAPADINTGLGLVLPEMADSIAAMAAKGLR